MSTRTPTPHSVLSWQVVVGTADLVLGVVSVIMRMLDLDQTTGSARHELTRRTMADASADATVAPPVTFTSGRGRAVDHSSSRLMSRVRGSGRSELRC